MKKLLSLITTAVIAYTCIACTNITADGEIITQTKGVSATANKISVSSTIQLTLSDELAPGEISVTAHENIHRYVRISNYHDELSIEMSENNIRGLYVAVVASSKQYNSIEATGASRVSIDGAAATFDYYDIYLSGTASISGEITAQHKLEVELSGTSSAKISGSADECQADLSGTSKLSDISFSCRTLDVDLSGTSKITMSVSDEINGKLEGVSTIKYKGNPKISAKTLGTSSVKAI